MKGHKGDQKHGKSTACSSGGIRPGTVYRISQKSISSCFIPYAADRAFKLSAVKPFSKKKLF